ncbi:PEP-CTERM sorting domain-containing protein [Lacipirellula sp.]
MAGQVVTVPEPSTIALSASALVALAAVRRRQ